eukprot:SAG31_NODE_39462_length_288_cov_0.703704_1_plen_72_part_10
MYCKTGDTRELYVRNHRGIGVPVVSSGHQRTLRNVGRDAGQVHVTILQVNADLVRGDAAAGRDLYGLVNADT